MFADRLAGSLRDAGVRVLQIASVNRGGSAILRATMALQRALAGEVTAISVLPGFFPLY